MKSEGFEFIFAGAGERILNGYNFTARHKPLGQGAESAVSAALSAMSRFMSEEMAGQNSQFYNLRTGGHYRIFYGQPNGIYQLHYSVNHWIINMSGEAVVTRIALPYVAGSYECFVEFNVNEGWQLSMSQAIALAPLLHSPRQNSKLEIKPVDVLKSEIADCTFHICWTDDAHEAFVVSVSEPRFSFTDDGFKKLPHEDVTLDAVQNAFSRMARSG